MAAFITIRYSAIKRAAQNRDRAAGKQGKDNTIGEEANRTQLAEGSALRT